MYIYTPTCFIAGSALAVISCFARLLSYASPLFLVLSLTHYLFVHNAFLPCACRHHHLLCFPVVCREHFEGTGQISDRSGAYCRKK